VRLHALDGGGVEIVEAQAMGIVGEPLGERGLRPRALRASAAMDGGQRQRAGGEAQDVAARETHGALGECRADRKPADDLIGL
jgi:hypothetical protein